MADAAEFLETRASTKSAQPYWRQRSIISGTHFRKRRELDWKKLYTCVLLKLRPSLIPPFAPCCSVRTVKLVLLKNDDLYRTWIEPVTVDAKTHFFNVGKPA